MAGGEGGWKIRDREVSGQQLRQADNACGADLPAFCSVSMFWGLVASSATICTNCVRAFWYCSNTEETDPVEVPCGPRRQPSRVPADLCHTLQHLPLAHGVTPASPGAGGRQLPRPLPPLGWYWDPFLCVHVSRATDSNRIQPPAKVVTSRPGWGRLVHSTNRLPRVAPAWGCEGVSWAGDCQETWSSTHRPRVAGVTPTGCRHHTQSRTTKHITTV